MNPGKKTMLNVLRKYNYYITNVNIVRNNEIKKKGNK